MNGLEEYVTSLIILHNYFLFSLYNGLIQNLVFIIHVLHCTRIIFMLLMSATRAFT